MDAFRITVIRVAGRAFLDHPGFIPFPGGHLVDVLMAILTLNIVDEMGAGVMFRPFLLMTPMAGHRLSMNSSPFSFRMGFDIRNIPVAAIAGIGSVNGLGKLPLIDLTMTAQAIGVINTFIAIFPALDDEFFSLFSGFSWLGYCLGFRALFIRSGVCRPQKPNPKTEAENESDKNGD